MQRVIIKNRRGVVRPPVGRDLTPETDLRVYLTFSLAGLSTNDIVSAAIFRALTSHAEGGNHEKK